MSSVFDFLKRDGELVSDNLNRIEIWTAAFQVIFDDLKLFFGHGLHGFGKNFPPDLMPYFLDQKLQTTHNALLQYTVDFGIIGLGIFIFIFANLLTSSLRIKERIIFVLLIATFFYGITESIPTFYSFEPTLLFLSLAAILFLKNERENG
jgi:O-antigen ligase